MEIFRQLAIRFMFWRKLYTREDVIALAEAAKAFDSGAVDEPLSRHVDKCLEEAL